MRFVKYDITFLDFQGFQGKEKQNDCPIKF